ncbi:MAG: endopeptidase La [Anaerolineales bacterium]|nr:endopeptidase La [Anaerolineales bacterium]
MIDEEPFENSQYPDFLGSLSEFEDLIFDIDDDADPIIECPFIPLRDIVLFPRMVMPLFVGRDRSLAAIQAAKANEEMLIVAAQRDSEVADPTVDDIYAVGTEVAIARALRMPDNSTSVLAQGRRRVQILEFTQWNPYIRARARIIPEPRNWQPTVDTLMRAVVALFEKAVDLSRKLPEDAYTFAINIDDPGWLADFIGATLDLPAVARQELLEILEPEERLRRVSMALGHELEVLELEDQIQSKVQEEVERSQREHFLREQIRVLQGELGDADIFGQELEELRAEIDARNLPAEVKAKADKELARLAAMPPMAPEVGIIRTYLDWIVNLPWLERTEDRLDVQLAADILNEDHYGLDRVKDRVLEYIAVRSIASDTMRTPILCFVGPPGTGKTSMGKSIARAMGRQFIRISLGGVHDEAEIRGHRRTYIGALPGRIIQAMRRSGTRNPLFMLDEVDKIGQDFRGDPASALLEVLDPEQNSTFADHYLDLDFDLSSVMFITTANTLHTIPEPLLDRMEVIEFSGYLEEEKLEICHQFLVERQMEQHGLANRNIRFEEDALRTLIRQYTYEAGVRNLEREIANVCRKIARRVAEKKTYPKRISAKRLTHLLGRPRFSEETLRDEDEVGVVTGVAWTAGGGDIMIFEVNLTKGKGGLTLTGQLGDVMQESAQTALTYVRSQAQVLGIDEEMFEKFDVHLHVPEGAVPKDGPSAGITMAAALISAFTGRPVRRDVGMTGEITLRGRVLPVGGIREKALAARRAGVTTFILPKKNMNSLEDIPKRLRQDLHFVFVERMPEVWQIALH